MKSEFKLVDLYTQKRYSVKQISHLFKTNEYSVRKVLKKHHVAFRNRSEAIRALNITKYHKEQFTLKSRLSARQEEMKIAGTMLYWGEGTKGGNSVVFSNSDAEMVRVFLKFLRTICGISNSRLRVVLHHYKDQNEYQLKQFWSKKTLIPLSQFSKSYLHRLQKGSYKRISQFGTLSVRYSDKKLLEIINSWIKDCARHL